MGGDDERVPLAATTGTQFWNGSGLTVPQSHFTGTEGPQVPFPLESSVHLAGPREPWPRPSDRGGALVE